MKNLIKKIFFWSYLPLKIRYILQCFLYSNHIFKFRFLSNCFVINFQKNIKIYTNENPFDYNILFKIFIKNYKFNKGDVILEGGAYNGHLTCLFSHIVSDSGHIFAFEPDENNYKSLINNLKLNKIRNVSHFKLGLWVENTVLDFYSQSSVSSSIFFKSENSIIKNINVISIDYFVKAHKIKKLDLIKLNVEGSEIEILNGASETLLSLKPKIILTADHIVDGELTYKKIINILILNNYKYKMLRLKKNIIVVIGEPLS